MARVLITRISSFGDVAMLVPVVYSVAAQYPQDRFIVLTRKAFAPLFENIGFNISALTYDVSKQHNGILGLLSILKTVSKNRYSHVADVHDVLRTKVIRAWLLPQGKRIAVIDKGRLDKKNAILNKNLDPPLKPTIQRYQEVFDKLGFPAEMSFTNYFEFTTRSFYPLRSVLSNATEKKGKWIGIAPFAKHQGKIYPLDKMEKIVKTLSEISENRIFLFGSGKEEKEMINKWANSYTNVTAVSGKLNLQNELMLISYLDVMVSMDSANMHLASLVEVPVVSIWGATHPAMGFYGFKQNISNTIQTDIECRPCSVFGDLPCSRGDYACLHRIEEKDILSKINEVLASK